MPSSPKISFTTSWRKRGISSEQAVWTIRLPDPSVAFAGVTTSNGRNVVLERSSQLGGVGDGADPGWELVVPKKVVWFDL